MFTVVGRVRVSVSLCFLLASAPSLFADPHAPPSARVSVPASVQCSPEILARVEQMLAQSATFRSQFRRVVERPRVILSASIDPSIVERSFRARSVIRRYDSGLVIVRMMIGPGAHLDEFIAHEFEHVLEHLEGLKLTEMARRRDAGVWFSGPNTVETSRATRAGRVVADELRRSGRGATASAEAKRLINGQRQLMTQGTATAEAHSQVRALQRQAEATEEALPDIAARLGDELDAELRPRLTP